MEETTFSKITNIPYADDTPASVYKELKDGEAAILGAAAGYFTLIEDEVRKHDEYEAAKNSTLKAMFDEEADKTVPKRTELQRQASYRLMHRLLRLEWQLAKRDVEAHRSYLEALLCIQTSIEARAKLISIDERFAGSRYTT